MLYNRILSRNYDTDNWQRIAQYLNSEEYRNIRVLNRAQIIDDAFYFAVEKKLEFSIFWRLANYLSKETDYIAWYTMLKIFEYISNIFAFSEIDDKLKVNIQIDFINKLSVNKKNAYNTVSLYHNCEIIV